MINQPRTFVLPKKPKLSEHLRSARLRRGMSVADLAETCGVSPAAVYTWENGTSRPRGDNLSSLCRALKLPIRATRELAA